MSLVLGLSAILSIGPDLQRYTVALLTSAEVSIYSTAYESSLVQLPSLGDWVRAAVDPIFIAMAAIIVLVSVRAIRARAFFVTASVVTFLVLTGFDAYFQLASDNPSPSEFFVCFLSNLLGSPIVVSVILLIVALSEIVSKSLAHHKLVRSILVPSIPAVIGVLLIVASYYLVITFYNPTESRFVAHVASPMSVSFASANAVGSEGIEAKNASFGILTGKVRSRQPVHWIGMSDAVDLQWQRDSNLTYDLYVDYFDGCVDGRKIRDRARHVFARDVSQVSLKSDKGLSDILLSKDGKGGIFKLSATQPGMFWVSANADESTKSDVSTFVGNDAALQYWSRSEAIYVELAMTLMEHSELSDESSLNDREVNLHVDGRRTTVRFRAKPRINWDEAVPCKRHALIGTSEHAIESGIRAGVSLRIEPREAEALTSVGIREVDPLRVTGLNGWISARGLRTTEVSNYFSSGTIGFIVLPATKTELSVNGEAVDTSNVQGLVIAQATMTAAINEEAELTVEGRSKAILADGARVNRTRWERLEMPGRVAIVGGIPTAFLWFFSVLSGILRRDDQVGFELFQ